MPARRAAPPAPPTLPPLTDRQRQILAFIAEYTAIHALPPGIRDIGNALDIKSPNGVMAHLRLLVKKGYIQRPGGKMARGLLVPAVAAATRAAAADYLAALGG